MKEAAGRRKLWIGSGFSEINYVQGRIPPVRWGDPSLEFEGEIGRRIPEPSWDPPSGRRQTCSLPTGGHFISSFCWPPSPGNHVSHLPFINKWRHPCVRLMSLPLVGLPIPKGLQP